MNQSCGSYYFESVLVLFHRMVEVQTPTDFFINFNLYLVLGNVIAFPCPLTGMLTQVKMSSIREDVKFVSLKHPCTSQSLVPPTFRIAVMW